MEWNHAQIFRSGFIMAILIAQVMAKLAEFCAIFDWIECFVKGSDSDSSEVNKLDALKFLCGLE